MNITPKKMRVGNNARPASRELAGAKRLFIGEGMRQYFQTLVQEVVKKWKGFVRVLWWEGLALRLWWSRLLRVAKWQTEIKLDFRHRDLPKWRCSLALLGQPPPGTRDRPRSSEIFVVSRPGAGIRLSGGVPSLCSVNLHRELAIVLVARKFSISFQTQKTAIY
jgi:hypothetical protein